MFVEELGPEHLPLIALEGGMWLAQATDRSKRLKAHTGTQTPVTSLVSHVAERLGAEKISPSLSGIG